MLAKFWNSGVLLKHFLEHGCSYHHQVLCHTGNLATGRQENSPGLLSNGVILLHVCLTMRDPADLEVPLKKCWIIPHTYRFGTQQFSLFPTLKEHLSGHYHYVADITGTYNRYVEEGYHTLQQVLPTM